MRCWTTTLRGFATGQSASAICQSRSSVPASEQPPSIPSVQQQAHDGDPLYDTTKRTPMFAPLGLNPVEGADSWIIFSK